MASSIRLLPSALKARHAALFALGIGGAAGAIRYQTDEGTRRSVYFWSRAFPIYLHYRYPPLPPARSPSSSPSSSPLCPHGPIRISRSPFSGEESGAAFTGSRTRGGLRASPPEICPGGGGYHLASEGLLHQGTDQDGEEEV
ncbi:hypothetical protein NGA_0649400, partial [Nannochloropsis gaditana CCMP526]|uniref:uncharacterized protein n=1 Tax=Nannochloropsis gaditana (strain CCMP526) TaxID=1093141 RepID=UPI00029F56F1